MDMGQHHGSRIAKTIWVVGSPLVFLIGVIGNIGTILILSNRNQRKTSTTVYLTVLAIADLCVMIISLPRWWIIYIFERDIRHLSNGICKLHWFFAYFSGGASTSILTAVTIEKIISTVRPYKVKTLCTVKNAVVTSSIIILCQVAIHGHVLYGMKLFDKEIHYNLKEVAKRNEYMSVNGHSMINNTVEYKIAKDNLMNVNITPQRNLSFIENGSVKNLHLQSKVCWFDDFKYGVFYSGMFQVINALFYNILPEITFFIGGLIIVRKLTASKQLRSRNSQDHLSQVEPKARKPMFEIHSRQITISLILVNIVFVVCTTPVICFLIGRSVWIDSDKGMTETQEITWAVLNMLFYINHAINFILYFLSGARFRKQAIRAFLCKKENNLSNMSLSRAASIERTGGHHPSEIEMVDFHSAKNQKFIEEVQDDTHYSSFQLTADDTPCRPYNTSDDTLCRQESSLDGNQCNKEITVAHHESSLSDGIYIDHCNLADLCNGTDEDSHSPLSEGSHQNLHILLQLRSGCSGDTVCLDS